MVVPEIAELAFTLVWERCDPQHFPKLPMATLVDLVRTEMAAWYADPAVCESIRKSQWHTLRADALEQIGTARRGS